MSYIELFLLAAGLCFDTFAVSLTGGICTRGSLCVRQILRIIFCFAVFQAGLTFAGWLLGYSVSDYISKVDHWVAFVLLGYIGVKMIIEGCSKKEEEVSGTSLLNTRQLVLLSVATSIDAVAVGISLAMIKLSFLKIGITTAMVLACTALASLAGLLAGLLGGRRLGAGIGRKSEILGGLILIAIGAKILIEHLSV